jgi:hypothetical protein
VSPIQGARFNHTFYGYVVERDDGTADLVTGYNLVLVRTIEDPTMAVARDVLATPESDE